MGSTRIASGIVGKGLASNRCDVAVIGAGPYGLSAAAHLRAKGMGVCVFGEPMEFWARKMPEGMLLRSPRVASNLSDPRHALTLEAYEEGSKIHPRAPLPLDTFVDYGRWFGQGLDVNFDRRTIARINRDHPGFRLTLQDGEEILVRFVVVAAGIGPFRKKPAVFENLPIARVVHCYENRDVRRYSGERVAVIGSGQSALESAALLHEVNANVEIIARQPQLRWIGQHRWLHHMGPISKMLYSSHDVGPLGISRLVAYPNLMAMFPRKLRDKMRSRAVRPAGSQWLPARLAQVKISAGRNVANASIAGEELLLKLDDGTERRVDRVILGTGYQVDISRYDFLPSELVREVQVVNGYPKLSQGFRSSVPGLHFIGATAAQTFGPLLYFVAGTEFAARELTGHLSRNQMWSAPYPLEPEAPKV